MRKLVLLLALSFPLAAEPLTEIRTTLGRFTARQPIRATYELQRNELQEGKLGNNKYNGKVAVDVEGDANGVRVSYARPLIDQSFKERRAKQRDAKLTTPTASTLREISPMSIAESLDFTPRLLQFLDGATVKEDRAGTLAGKPARVVVLRLLDEKPDSSIGKVTVADNRLTLWLGSDGVPLAAEHNFAVKFSVLLIKGELKEKSSWHFSTHGDRLVPVRYETSQSQSGMGQKGSTSSVATVRVE